MKIVLLNERVEQRELINEEYSLESIKKEIKEKINLDKLRFSVCCSDSTASL